MLWQSWSEEGVACSDNHDPSEEHVVTIMFQGTNMLWKSWSEEGGACSDIMIQVRSMLWQSWSKKRTCCDNHDQREEHVVTITTLWIHIKRAYLINQSWSEGGAYVVTIMIRGRSICCDNHDQREEHVVTIMIRGRSRTNGDNLILLIQYDRQSNFKWKFNIFKQLKYYNYCKEDEIHKSKHNIAIWNIFNKVQIKTINVLWLSVKTSSSMLYKQRFFSSIVYKSWKLSSFTSN